MEGAPAPSQRRRAGLTVAALATVALTALAAVGGLGRPLALLQRQRAAGAGAAATSQSLEYFADLGYKHAEKCDGSVPTAQQSPVAIDVGGVGGDVGNVVQARLPPVGWVQNEGLNGLYRMKTPGTDTVTGEPNVKAFVSGNKFDMSEAAVHTTYGGAKYRLDHFVLKTPR
jgi:hypothetical protein